MGKCHGDVSKNTWGLTFEYRWVVISAEQLPLPTLIGKG